MGILIEVIIFFIKNKKGKQKFRIIFVDNRKGIKRDQMKLQIEKLELR